jgi:hypothetical protein
MLRQALLPFFFAFVCVVSASSSPDLPCWKVLHSQFSALTIGIAFEDDSTG